MSIQYPILIPIWGGQKLKERNVPPAAEQNLKISSIGGLRARLKEEGTSKKSFDLILFQKDQVVTQIINWARENELDGVLEGRVIHITLDFLFHLFKNRLQYGTINSYTCAISPFHKPIPGKTVGENPIVCTLLADVSNSRPPQPRNCFI